MFGRFAAVAVTMLALAGCGAAATDPPTPVASVDVTVAHDTVLVGSSTAAIATMRDATGATLVGRSVSWSSSAPSIASVDGVGTITALAPGEVTITATSEGRSGSDKLLVRSQPRAWTVEPAGVWDTQASVRGEDSFATLVAFCDLSSGGQLLWGFNLRQLGHVPFATGVAFALHPERPGDPEWDFNASASHGGVLTLSVGTASEAGTAGAMQALVRSREEAVLTYPSGSPVQAVTVRFDLRDGARALAEAEAICRAG